MKVEIDSMAVVVAVKDAQFQSFRNKNIIKLDAQFDQ